ncbi:MAG: ABC transporter substrate-binding protein [Rhodospirillales bacterium]|nr:ABC transporter substrate-binding protein [Rhodospirillales bacterium]
MPRIRLVSVSFLLTFCLLTHAAQAQTEVRVIGYTFPPFVFNAKQGVSQDFIKLLNAAQSEFRFTFVFTSPNRRYRLFEHQQGDLIFFEMPEWGWQESGTGYEMTRQILSGGEVYVAKARAGRSQSFFDDILSKRIAAYAGYHYGFAQFNADPTWLRQKFRITLTNDHDTNIRVLLANRVDVSVVSKSYLSRYLRAKPHLQGKLLISEKKDQVYRLAGLVRKAGPISVRQVENILDKIKESGELEDFFAKIGLKNDLVY